MNRPKRFGTAFPLLAACTLLLLTPITAKAQQTGSVSGTVTDAGTGRPIAGAQVTVADRRAVRAAFTGQALQTGEDGSFVLDDVTAGPALIRVRVIGYTSMEVSLTVVAGDTTAAVFELHRSVITLDAVVVTGTGVQVERKRIGNTVATIEVADLENAPVRTFSEILQGREPSLMGLTSSGLAGEGMRIRIRGSNSLSMSNEPVVYLDGIRINNAGGIGGGIYIGGGGSPSRLDDINPEAIERVEVLKGAAAATLYGSEASSGIIQIFTKRGQAGRPRFSVRMEQGFSRYPDRVKPNAGFARDSAQAATMSQMYGMEIEPFQIVERTFFKDMLETGRSQTFSADVNGGSPEIQYYVSGRFAVEDGPFGGQELGPARDFNRRYQTTASLIFFPRERLSVRVVANYSQLKHEVPINNNSFASPILQSMSGKPELANCNASNLDTTRTLGATTPICTGAGNPMGSSWYGAGWTTRNAMQLQNGQDAGHFNGSVTADLGLTPTLNVTATFGIDETSDRSFKYWRYGYNVDHYNFDADSIPEGSPAERPPDGGWRIVEALTHREVTFDTRISWAERFGQHVSSEFLIGTQGYFTEMNTLYVETDGFSAFGLDVVQAASNHFDWEGYLSKINLGILTQEQLGFLDFAFVTLGGRWDRNSTFGKNAGAAFYPKASISIVPSDLSFWDSWLLSSIRLRAAYGASGLQPGAFDKLTTYNAVALTSGSGILPANLGNPNLAPERSSELELGTELGLFGDRASIDVTYWDRATTDALVQRAFAAGGFTGTQLFNIGRLDAHGWELKLEALLLDREDIALRFFANAAYLDESITSMGGVAPIGVIMSPNYLAEGYAPGSFFGRQLLPTCAPGVDRTCYTPGTTVPFDSDRNGVPDTEAEFRGFLTSDASITLDDGRIAPMLDDEDGDGDVNDHFLGKPVPDWQGAVGAELTVFRNLTINTLFEYRTGDYWVSNQTGALRRGRSLGRNVREVAEVEAVLLDSRTQQDGDARFDAATRWGMEFISGDAYAGLNLVERADFVRWRELSVTYATPTFLAQRFGMDKLTLTLAARNLHLFTRYSGTDPEGNQYGRCGRAGETWLQCNFSEGVDSYVLPLPRSFLISIGIGF